jgi:hypothetical protein
MILCTFLGPPIPHDSSNFQRSNSGGSQVSATQRPKGLSWCFLRGICNNVVKTIINNPFGNGLYQLIIYGDLGMVYHCFTHINCNIDIDKNDVKNGHNYTTNKNDNNTTNKNDNNNKIQ